MSYSDNFPAQRASFMADFANGGRIDPRMTFTRSDTPPTYAAPSAVHYWSNEKHLSSENLLLQSSDFDTTWTSNGILNGPTGGQSDPVGGTAGFELVESTSNITHRVFQNISATGELALTVYAKQNSGTRYLMLKLFNSDYNWEVAVFDLAGGAAATASGSSSSFTSVTTSQSASGNGFYKCVLKATGTITTANIALKDAANTSGLSSVYGSFTYTGDGTSSIDVAFASLSTTGATDYNATTTQIHREYAPTLKSVGTAGQPRFEYDPASDGQSVAKGILIEGSSQNLVTYSQTLSSWAANVAFTVTDGAAVGPDGTLSASSLTPNTTNALHFLQDSVTTVASTTYTMSAYVKPAGYTNFRLSHFQSASPYTGTTGDYSLIGDGTATSADGTATITKLQDGWYRITLTAAATSTTTILRMYGMSPDPAVASFTPNEYSGILCTGVQFEANSFASSYIKSNSGSATTRAAESLSMDLTQAGFNGGPSSVVVEMDGGAGEFPSPFCVSDGTTSNQYRCFRNSATATSSDDYRFRYYVDGTSYVNRTASSSNAAAKIGMSVDTDSVITCIDGGNSSTDTSAPLTTMTQLDVGGFPGSVTQKFDGTCKRIAVYGTALSQTELEALTS